MGLNIKNGATLEELPDKLQILWKKSRILKKSKKLKTFQKLLEWISQNLEYNVQSEQAEPEQ